METELERRARAQRDEPEARSAARGRVRGRVRAVDGTPIGDAGSGSTGAERIVARWPALAGCVQGPVWLSIQADLGRSPRTIDAYARALGDYLGFCDRADVDVVSASRADVAAYVCDLRERPGWRGANVVVIDSGAGLSNATLRLRLTAVRLFYDYLVEEGFRDRNPVGRGRYRSGRRRAR